MALARLEDSGVDVDSLVAARPLGSGRTLFQSVVDSLLAVDDIDVNKT
jgi:hypothetical protein